MKKVKIVVTAFLMIILSGCFASKTETTQNRASIDFNRSEISKLKSLLEGYKAVFTDLSKLQYAESQLENQVESNKRELEYFKISFQHFERLMANFLLNEKQPKQTRISVLNQMLIPLMKYENESRIVDQTILFHKSLIRVVENSN